MKISEQKKIIKLLRDDEEYYNGVGKKFRSNSDIYKLMNDPESFGKPSKENINFILGGYVHTAILEPEKLVANYPVSEASSRVTKAYKEDVVNNSGKMMITRKEVEKCTAMIDRIMNNSVCLSLLTGSNVITEEPGIKEIEGTWWKGKADCINKDKKLLIDIKTTGDITKFRRSATIYNYDSQAYIYREIFGYDLVFLVICKKTLQIAIYDCSEEFYSKGEQKVIEALEAYEMLINDPLFDMKDFVKTDTL
tara:strand:+ start:1323 stop:2075 length:753 start_codon:yes stop_codon:yes gene_type:complete